MLFELCGTYSYSMLVAGGKDDPAFTVASMFGFAVMAATLMVMWREAKRLVQKNEREAA